MRSIRPNPEWVEAQRDLTAKTSAMMRQTYQEIADLRRDSFWKAQRAGDEMQRKFSNDLLDFTDVADTESGETYTVSSGHIYYWRQVGGDRSTLRGTELDTPPDIDFVPLREF